MLVDCADVPDPGQLDVGEGVAGRAGATERAVDQPADRHVVAAAIELPRADIAGGVAGRTFTEGGLDTERVALHAEKAGQDDAAGQRPTPLVVGMTAGGRESSSRAV